MEFSGDNDFNGDYLEGKFDYGKSKVGDGEYVPSCDEDKKPYVHQVFSNLKEGEDFYRDYGAACGFDVRLGQVKKASDGTVIQRYIYCNREGEGGKVNQTCEKGEDYQKKRRRLTTRVGCMARIVLKICGSMGYVVDVFVEAHTHPFVSENYRHFLKCNRNMDDVHQNFIMNCAKSNIGPMKSFRLFKEIVGSYRDVGCSSVDFANFSRDLKAFVDGVDAQLLLDKFRSRKEIFPNFTYYFSVNSAEKLTRIFWADTTSIKMYRAFGQAVSFDATYETNKYNMVFTPFTGKDNHGKCVTFGAALLTSEDAESYSWVLDKFMECMKSPPAMIITDQDPALKIAVERVMPNTKHRLCMWHIMKKVATKISPSLRESEGFSKEFNDIVWSETIEPVEFESKWNMVMEEYDLLDNEWFSTMFALRERWIPAYFKDVPMSGLFRTTSLSESENSFFQRYSHKKANLLTFLMHFESAIDAQRNGFDKLRSVDESSIPKSRNDSLFERHAASIYTTRVFLDKIQAEIRWATSSCSIVNIKQGPIVTTYDIQDCWLDKVLSVYVTLSEETYECECNYFVRYGLLCRHIYSVFKNCCVRRIPAKYITPRWTRYAVSDSLVCIADDCQVGQNEKLYLMNVLHQSSQKCARLVGGDVDRMKALILDFQSLEEKYANVVEEDGNTVTKDAGFQDFYGISIPENVCVLPPDPVKTKGSGSDMQSRRDKAIRDASKPKRKCSKCKQMANHDARNCPSRG